MKEINVEKLLTLAPGEAVIEVKVLTVSPRISLVVTTTETVYLIETAG